MYMYVCIYIYIYIYIPPLFLFCLLLCFPTSRVFVCCSLPLPPQMHKTPHNPLANGACGVQAQTTSPYFRDT